MSKEIAPGYNPGRGLAEYNQARLLSIINSDLNPDPLKNPNIYVVRDDGKNRGRLRFPPLRPYISPKGGIRIATVDDEGRIYQVRWGEIKRMNKDDVVVSPARLSEKVYKKVPKGRKLIRLMVAYYPAGIDVALRGSERIREKYVLSKPEENSRFDNKEATQMIQGYHRLRQLRQDLALFKELTPERLDEILEENLRYIDEYNLRNPIRRDKIRLKKSMEGGFRDKLGRKNILAALSRMFSAELALRRQLEIHSPAVVLKYGANFEILRYFRDRSRLVLSTVSSELENEQTLRSLRILSEDLLKEVRVRPYILVARKAVELLGLVDLPEGSISRSVQDRGVRLNQDTVKSLMFEGDSDGAREMLKKIRQMLNKVMEVHEDYLHVKPSRKKTRKSKQGVSNV